MDEHGMMTFVERFAAMFKGPQLDLADALFAPDFIGHVPLVPVVNRDTWKQYVANVYTGIPDLTQIIQEVILGEDRLVLQVSFMGTHKGPLFRMLATGTPVTFDGVSIFRFDDQGQVAEIWTFLDWMGLLAQIGGFSRAEGQEPH